MFRKYIYVFLFILSLTCFSDTEEKLKKGIMVYVPFENSTDIYLNGDNLLLNAFFKRNSNAYSPDFKKFLKNEPRIVKGKIGNGIFLESGTYGDFRRGTKNLLLLNSSKADGFPSGFNIIGNVRAKIIKNRCLVSKKTVKLLCEKNSGISTKKIKLPYAMRYIASVYLKGEKGGEIVSLIINDLTNKIEEKKQVVLDKKWKRYYVILPYKEREKEYKDKKLKEPIECEFQILSDGNFSFFFDALMLEQCGIYYSNRFFPSTWIEGGKERMSEVLNLPVSKKTFNPERGSVVFWMKPEGEKGIRRTYFSIGYGWDTPLCFGQFNNEVCFYNFMEKKVYFKKELLNRWSFVAITWDGNKSSVYIDGEKVVEVNAEKGFDSENIWKRHIFIMPGNSESGYPFASKTHINGIIDEFYIFKVPLSDQEIKYIQNLKSPLVEIPDVTVKYDYFINVFNREKKEVSLRYLLINNKNVRKKVDVNISTENFGFEKKYSLLLKPLEKKKILYDFPVGELVSGEYRIKIETRYNDKNLKSKSNIEVGPYRNKNVLPVLAWNAGEKNFEEMELLKKMGVNIVPARIIDPETEDWASRLGIYNFLHMSVRGKTRNNYPEDRIVKVDGSFDGPNPLSEYVQKTAKDQAENYMEYVVNYPSLKYIIVNTEWQLPMDFSKKFQGFVKEKFGIDLKKWMCDSSKAWWYLMPHNRLNPTLLGEKWFPEKGVVKLNDNFYKYHLWWHKGNANEVIINKICLEKIKEERKDITTIIEPILRSPPVKRYKKNVDVAEEWFYYENPRVAVNVQERLAAISRGSEMKPSGMPQFLFKPGGAAPYAVTPPPDMLKEVLWLCASRPLKMMSFWGWHRVLNKGKMLSYEEVMKIMKGKSWKDAIKIGRKIGEGGGLYIPEVKDEFSQFAKNVWQPYGILFKNWKNYPRKVVVVDSFASFIYSNVRWPNFGLLGDSLISSGIPFDVVYDEDFFDNKNLLSPYQIVVLPNTYALPENAYNQIKKFAEKGGIVIADENFKVKGIPGIKIFSKEQMDVFKKYIKEKTELPVKVETDNIIWNLLVLNGANYLVVVNDKREYGKYLGMWKKVKERGIGQNVKIRIDKDSGRYIFDISERRIVKAKREGNFYVFNSYLGGCEGKIFLLLKNRTGRPVLNLKKIVKRGSYQHMEISINGRNRAGGILFKYDIMTPAGKVFDISGYGITDKNGKLIVDFIIPVNAEKGKWKVKVENFISTSVKSCEFVVE